VQEVQEGQTGCTGTLAGRLIMFERFKVGSTDHAVGGAVAARAPLMKRSTRVDYHLREKEELCTRRTSIVGWSAHPKVHKAFFSPKGGARVEKWGSRRWRK